MLLERTDAIIGETALDIVQRKVVLSLSAAFMRGKSRIDSY